MQAAEKDPYASLHSIASRQRTADVRLRSSIIRAPRLWIFLSSLQEAFFQQPAKGGSGGEHSDLYHHDRPDDTRLDP